MWGVLMEKSVSCSWINHNYPRVPFLPIYQLPSFQLSGQHTPQLSPHLPQVRRCSLSITTARNWAEMVPLSGKKLLWKAFFSWDGLQGLLRSAHLESRSHPGTMTFSGLNKLDWEAQPLDEANTQSGSNPGKEGWIQVTLSQLVTPWSQWWTGGRRKERIFIVFWLYTFMVSQWEDYFSSGKCLQCWALPEVLGHYGRAAFAPCCPTQISTASLRSTSPKGSATERPQD